MSDALLPNFSDYIVFVDESGSPTLNAIDPTYPIFVLVFCIVDKTEYADEIQPAIKKLKFEFFGHDMIVLHSHDIQKPKNEFSFLLHPERREYFMRRLNQLIENAKMHLVVHVIDKMALRKKYTQPFDPYNIALRMCLEKTSIFLKKNKQSSKLTHVITESRGKKEDGELELEFRRILDPSQNWGMAHKFPLHETPFELKFVEKKINSAGLQLADLAGQPIGRHILNPERKNRAFELSKAETGRDMAFSIKAKGLGCFQGPAPTGHFQSI